MASKNETVEEVCGELKEVANGNNVSNDGLVVEISQEEIWGALDRIEAAHKRDVKELCKCLKAASMTTSRINVLGVWGVVRRFDANSGDGRPCLRSI